MFILERFSKECHNHQNQSNYSNQSQQEQKQKDPIRNWSTEMQVISVTIGFGLTSEWLRRCRELFYRIRERSKAKPQQTQHFFRHWFENCFNKSSEVLLHLRHGFDSVLSSLDLLCFYIFEFTCLLGGSSKDCRNVEPPPILVLYVVSPFITFSDLSAGSCSVPSNGFVHATAMTDL